jgi:hypothetical protein
MILAGRDGAGGGACQTWAARLGVTITTDLEQ